VLPVDTVVVCAGQEPLRDLKNELEGAYPTAWNGHRELLIMLDPRAMYCWPVSSCAGPFRALPSAASHCAAPPARLGSICCR
jgi:hypothetical protein